MCVCVGKCALVWAKMRVCVCVVGKSVCVRVHTWTNVCAMKKASQVLTKTKWHERSRSSLAGSYTSKKFAAGKDDFFFKKKFCSAENTKTTSFLKSCNELDVFNKY